MSEKQRKIDESHAQMLQHYARQENDMADSWAETNNKGLVKAHRAYARRLNDIADFVLQQLREKPDLDALRARLATVEAERDAARAEAARLDDLFMQAEGIAPDGELGISAAKVQRWYDDSQALKAAQTGEARAVEALRKLANEADSLRIAEYEIRAAIGNTNWSCLRLRIDEARALDTQPALAWLAQREAEAAAKALERVARKAEAASDPLGFETSAVRAIRDCFVDEMYTEAAALRAGATGGADA